MTAATLTAGYPPHRVTEYREWTNRHGYTFTDWTAACGATGYESGAATGAFKTAGQARRAELCTTCFPAGHHGSWPPPKRTGDQP